MIRFVYIGDQITEDEKEFAWYNTVEDKFIEFNSEQVWADWDDFEQDFKDAWEPYADEYDIERFRRLYNPPSEPDT